MRWSLPIELGLTGWFLFVVIKEFAGAALVSRRISKLELEGSKGGT